MGQDDNHGCELGFAEPAVVFKGPTQTARSVTEAWVALHGFCPNCTADRLTSSPPAIVIPGGGERSEPEARNPAARVSATLSGEPVRERIAFGASPGRASRARG